LEHVSGQAAIGRCPVHCNRSQQTEDLPFGLNARIERRRDAALAGTM